MNRFKDRVVLITGAAGGIGLAAARQFGQEGASVMLADVDAESAAAASEALGASGLSTSWTHVDVRDPASCREMVARTVSTFGDLHIAFNNAGVPTKPYISLEEFGDDEWDRAIGINLNGVFHSMKAELPALRRSNGTAIVNTASMMSGKSAPGMAAYVASKHGVAGLTKAVALDCIRHGIRVNAVCPGFVETPMLAPVIATEGGRVAVTEMVPAGRIAMPSEIAEAVLFLASEAASYMVGALLMADGGVTIA